MSVFLQLVELPQFLLELQALFRCSVQLRERASGGSHLRPHGFLLDVKVGYSTDKCLHHSFQDGVLKSGEM